MSEILPEAPSFEHLKNQAKSLYKSATTGDVDAVERVRRSHPRPIESADLTLADAQLVVAREYGFESWPKLKTHVEAKSAELAVEQFKTAVNDRDASTAGKLLKAHPSLRRNVDAPLFSFDTPAIVRAAHSNDRPMIDVLLAAGANVNARTSWEPGGFGALDNASTETAEYLISKGAYVDIHAAAKLGDLARVRELVEADPSLVNARGGDGQSPLHFASTVDVCAYLLDHGTDINMRDIDHISTAAQYSMRNPEKLRYLVDRGAEADIFIACRLGDKDLAGRLLNDAPDCLRWRLNHPDYRHDAGHIYVYTYGIATRPVTIAADFAGRDFLEYLLGRGSRIDRLLLGCAFVDKTAVGDVLRESPDIIATLAPDDAAFVSDAAWDNRIDAVRMALDAGFDINARGMDDGTALDRAAVRGWVDLVKLLIERGASVELTNQYGGWPLSASIWGSENWPRYAGNHAACVEALIAAGSKLPSKLYGSPGVQEILKRHGVEG